MKKLLSLFLLVFISIQVSQSQVPQSFNYQAVLRDASGNTLTNVNVAVITSLTQGTIDGTVVFAETHTGTTNEYGLINLQIGSINTSGFSEIDWTGGPYFLNINVNGTDLGTSQLLSNPFALVAEDVINKDDADADPLNEIQILSISNDTIFLSDGAYVKLPFDKVDDNDANPINEIQVLSISNDTISLSAAGGQVKLPSSNKIQLLSVSEYGDTLYISEGNFVIIPGISAPNYNLRDETIMDYDGNEYKVVMIGNQIWMAENLKSTHYSDGTEILLVEGAVEWDALSNTDKAYCWYNNSNTNRDTYGGLYTWAAAMNGSGSNDSNPSNVQGVCPDGWHLPSDSEWKELEIELGIPWNQIDLDGVRGDDEGGMLKEIGTSHWNAPNIGASDVFGFMALPAGRRNMYGIFQALDYHAFFWSTTTNEEGTSVVIRNLQNSESIINRSGEGFVNGNSIRCLKNR